jgi:hypothetical protein
MLERVNALKAEILRLRLATKCDQDITLQLQRLADECSNWPMRWNEPRPKNPDRLTRAFTEAHFS